MSNFNHKVILITILFFFLDVVTFFSLSMAGVRLAWYTLAWQGCSRNWKGELLSLLLPGLGLFYKINDGSSKAEKRSDRLGKTVFILSIFIFKEYIVKNARKSMILWKEATPQRMFSKIKTGKFLFSVEDFSSLQTFKFIFFYSIKSP